jgi:hypothetical protein
MSNIKTIELRGSATVFLSGLSVLEDIQSRFECVTRSDNQMECVIGSSVIDEEDSRKLLFEILDIKPDSPQAAALMGCGYVLLRGWQGVPLLTITTNHF